MALDNDAFQAIMMRQQQSNQQSAGLGGALGHVGACFGTHLKDREGLWAVKSQSVMDAQLRGLGSLFNSRQPGFIQRMMASAHEDIKNAASKIQIVAATEIGSGPISAPQSFASGVMASRGGDGFGIG